MRSSGVAARRAQARVGRAGVGVTTLIGTTMLVAGCGGGSSGQGVANLGTTTSPTRTTATTPAAVHGGSKSSPTDNAIAFVGCMRTHGEPNMPEPNVSKTGGRTHVSINVSSGVDPSSPLFAAAYKACSHLLPDNGVASAGQTITPADQADYLKGAACMRSHGVPNFPDPTFKNNTVAFRAQTPIDTSSAEYESALATCQKLIPAGLPYSSTSSP